jgi:hypothetical protein
MEGISQPYLINPEISDPQHRYFLVARRLNFSSGLKVVELGFGSSM